MSQDTIRNWEAGAVQHLPRIAEFLGESLFGSPSGADDFPARLTLAWRLLGLTQAELADQLGVDETTVGSWERGEHRPIRRYRQRLEALAASLGAELAASPWRGRAVDPSNA